MRHRTFARMQPLPGTDPLVVTLREMRIAQQVPQTVLAQRMGSTAQQISSVETGAQAPRLDWIRRYLQAMGLTLQVVSDPRGTGAG